MSQSDLIGADEAGDIAGASRATVKRAAIAGELPYALKMPGRTGAYLFHRADVEQWATARHADNTPDTKRGAA
jgi:excisionase family DNA binding protein